MPFLEKLPEDLLLQLAGLLNGVDLIAFSFSCRVPYKLSLESTVFWKHDVIPGLLTASGDGQTNIYREAAFRRRRFRRMISEGGDTFPRKSRIVVDNYLGKQITEVIVPGTHYLLAIAICNDVKKLVCFDLLCGDRVEVEGDIDPWSFKIDATRGANESLNILLVSAETYLNGPKCQECCFDIYKGVFTDGPSGKGQVLQIKRVARKQCRGTNLGTVQRLAVEGHYIIVETGSQRANYPGPSSFLIMDWSPSSPNSEPIIWHNPDNQPKQFIYDWQVVDDVLLATHLKPSSQDQCQLYAIPLNTVGEAFGLGLSLVPPSTSYPRVQGSCFTAVHRIVVDRMHVTRNCDGAMEIPLIAMGFIGNGAEYNRTKVCRLSLRVTLEEIANAGEDEKEILLEPSERYGAKVKLSTPPNILVFKSAEYVNTAKLNDGILWGLCDKKQAFLQWGQRRMYSTTLYVCDIDIGIPDPHSLDVKVITDLPDGYVHLVDMDLGVVCTVQSTEDDQEVETRIIVDWYS